MTRLGLDAASVRKEIENAVRNFPVGEAAGKIPFTPRARRALQLAADEAQLLNQPRIGAEHIFLGLILEGDGVAARILKNLGIGLEKAREETMTEMRANPGAS
jgi:ATP-dependent Clp protease ATP-binding subunit ClpC